ncbi:MAG TPA: dehydrogenase [Bacteroides sp.]|nr:dehydrogenase [Bacteroides sp.]
METRIQSKMTLALVISLLAITCWSQENMQKNDWPQWMGPERNGIWHLDLQKKSLNHGDLKKIWEVPVGQGYCGPTVADGFVYLMDYVGESTWSERVLCFDAKTGESVWTHEYERPYSGVGYPTGPRASVLIDEGRAYSFGTMGNLYCLDAYTGKELWHVDGVKDYDSEIPVWGLAASPLVEKDLLIVQMAGRPEACLMAFDKVTGKEVWRSLPDQASYSAPIVIDQAGKRVLVCWTGDNLAGLDTETGRVYWKIPFIRRKGIINISTPAYSPPYIFLSSFWDGSMLIRLDENDQDAELIWTRAGKDERNTDALHCCISTPFIQGDYIYGIDSYGEFRCLEMTKGDRVWTDKTLVPVGRWANAHLVRQDDKIWAFNELGELVLGEISESGFKDLGRVELVKPVSVSPNPRGGVNWSHPAFSGRKIFARSDAKLVCYELIR